MNTATVSPAEMIRAEMIMSRPLVTIGNNDTMRHAAAVFLDKNISGAPVFNHLQKPIGVLTKTDIVRYEREHAAAEATGERDALRTLGTLELIAKGAGFHRESEEDYVSRWMTPKVFAAGKMASLADVLREMSQRRIHRIFIQDEKTKKLIGVITTFDLMRFLGRLFLVGGTKLK